MMLTIQTTDGRTFKVGDILGDIRLEFFDGTERGNELRAEVADFGASSDAQAVFDAFAAVASEEEVELVLSRQWDITHEDV